MLAKNKAFILICTKYFDFANIFSWELVFELSKYTKINNHAIKLIDKQLLLYKLIYSLMLIKLKILKTYIKINLANSFIKSFKFLISAFIVFDKKLNKMLIIENSIIL